MEIDNEYGYKIIQTAAIVRAFTYTMLWYFKYRERISPSMNLSSAIQLFILAPFVESAIFHHTIPEICEYFDLPRGHVYVNALTFGLIHLANIKVGIGPWLVFDQCIFATVWGYGILHIDGFISRIVLHYLTNIFLSTFIITIIALVQLIHRRSDKSEFFLRKGAEPIYLRDGSRSKGTEDIRVFKPVYYGTMVTVPSEIEKSIKKFDIWASTSRIRTIHNLERMVE